MRHPTEPPPRPVNTEELAASLPDLALVVSRAGVLLGHLGGRGTGLAPGEEALGRDLATCWPAPIAQSVKLLVRRALRVRATAEGPIRDGARAWEARVTPQGPDRVLCTIRLLKDGGTQDAAEGVASGSLLDRQRFMERLRASVATARLREQPLALAVIHLDAVGDIARTLDAAVAERVTFAVLDRLRPEVLDAGVEEIRWYLGKLAEDSVGLVFECGDRDQIEARVATVCRSLREPVAVGDAAFHLTPYAGVAVLGTDADSPNTLLRHARAAADESRRAGSAAVGFFSDTLKLRSLARLDIARELREAIADGSIGLRYLGRHDLATGQRVAWVGYLQWTHPLRGEVRPAEFVNVAQATGQAKILSRAVLECLRRDFPRLMQHEPPDVRISFGALRNHVLHEDFCRDIAWLVGPGAVPADRLELRIAERTLVACETGIWGLLSDLGIRLVVDEVGREMSSLDRLARVPLWGLQLDRSWASALRRDPVALRVCGAGVGVATALGLTPIATGVDDAQQRDALRTLGCRQAMGDLYPSAPGERLAAAAAAAGQTV